ncbi:methyltransferase domain-containing protein [Pedobacter sp. SYSU D00535]|uniref:methyltransferase domain-containing protein n=1 Tax=Pedobacter sp. SYSU D00535 TaxID=2810308 RepID=UPI001A95FC2F|nr:methyltransferase domain-containing protein [Pedobacter sp. SYSU D00535]
MADFSKRSTEAEMMDDFNLGPETINPIMDELEVINRLLGGYAVFFNAFNTLNLKNDMIISDWGCGGGDSLRVLVRWARKKRLNLRFVGVDATATAIDYARNKSVDFPEISYLHGDVFSPELSEDQFDIVLSSLFTHHFKDSEWIALMQKMLKCSRYAVVVNDLHRHWFAYHSIGALTKAFSKSKMVKHDSQLSVLRGFKRAEIERMLAEAGITNYRLKWKWAFRWELILFKQEHASI